jgi:hypothetical protein
LGSAARTRDRQGDSIPSLVEETALDRLWGSL